MTFIDRLVSGQCSVEDIDDAIGGWHESPDDGREVYEYLGLTRSEYVLWCHDPRELVKIVEERRAEQTRGAR